MQKNNRIRLILWRWALIGLLIRFLVMPFTFHGSDIFFNYYPSFKLIEDGVLNPYTFLNVQFPDINYSYYPPVLFYIFSIFLFFLKPFLSQLHNLYAVFESWNFYMSANTVHYASLLSDFQLFRTLFFLKAPYLIFDYGTAFTLFKLLSPDERKSLLAFKIWMLNPFVLHSCYMVGQSDIILTLFVMLAVLCVLENKNYAAVLLLSLSAGTKGYPAMLIPPAILILANSLKDRMKLLFASLACLVIIALPFSLPSYMPMLGSFNIYTSPPLIRKFAFAFGYLTLFTSMVFFKAFDDKKVEYIISVFIITLLLFYITYVVTLRHFILITPFLIYIALKNKKFWIYNALFFITLFVLRTAGNTQQWGLFSSLYPEYFSGLPILDSYINVVVDARLIHQLMYRLFILTSAVMIVHLIMVNRRIFSLCVSKFSLR